MSIVTWSVQDLMTVSADASKTLSNFANYTSTVLRKTHHFDSAQFLTGMTLDGKAGTNLLTFRSDSDLYELKFSLTFSSKQRTIC